MLMLMLVMIAHDDDGNDDDNNDSDNDGIEDPMNTR